MGQFGSYEQAIAILKAKQQMLKDQVGDNKLTSATIGVLAGLDLAIKNIQNALVDEIREMESHYLFEAERDWKY